MDVAAQELLDVAVGEDLSVGRQLQHLPAVAEVIEEAVEIPHHERLADGAVDEHAGTLEELAELSQGLASERGIHVVSLEHLVVVPLAVHARRLDVAHPVHVDPQAAGEGAQLAPAPRSRRG
jgi:hypothetical protein